MPANSADPTERDEIVLADPFAVHVDHHDGAVTVRLHGALEGPGLDGLRHRLWPLIARYDGSMVTFEATGLHGVDSRAVRLLGQFARAIGPGRPRLLGVTPAVLRPLAEAGVHDWFEVEGAAGSA